MFQEVARKRRESQLETIQHQVNDHARDRYKQPQRKRPSSDAAVLVVLRRQASGHRNQNGGDDYGRENHVRDEDGEIDRPDPAGPPEWHRTDLSMVDHIRRQKQRRYDKSGDHARFMLAAVAPPNEHVAGDEQNCRACVERRVQRGEISDAHVTLAGGAMASGPARDLQRAR